jgi:hypothetical protein
LSSAITEISEAVMSASHQRVPSQIQHQEQDQMQEQAAYDQADIRAIKTLDIDVGRDCSARSSLCCSPVGDGVLLSDGSLESPADGQLYSPEELVSAAGQQFSPDKISADYGCYAIPITQLASTKIYGANWDSPWLQHHSVNGGAISQPGAVSSALGNGTKGQHVPAAARVDAAVASQHEDHPMNEQTRTAGQHAAAAFALQHQTVVLPALSAKHKRQQQDPVADADNPEGHPVADGLPQAISSMSIHTPEDVGLLHHTVQTATMQSNKSSNRAVMDAGSATALEVPPSHAAGITEQHEVRESHPIFLLREGTGESLLVMDSSHAGEEELLQPVHQVQVDQSKLQPVQSFVRLKSTARESALPQAVASSALLGAVAATCEVPGQALMGPPIYLRSDDTNQLQSQQHPAQQPQHWLKCLDALSDSSSAPLPLHSHGNCIAGADDSVLAVGEATAAGQSISLQAQLISGLCASEAPALTAAAEGAPLQHHHQQVAETVTASQPAVTRAAAADNTCAAARPVVAGHVLAQMAAADVGTHPDMSGGTSSGTRGASSAGGSSVAAEAAGGDAAAGAASGLCDAVDKVTLAPSMLSSNAALWLRAESPEWGTFIHGAGISDPLRCSTPSEGATWLVGQAHGRVGCSSSQTIELPEVQGLSSQWSSSSLQIAPPAAQGVLGTLSSNAGSKIPPLADPSSDLQLSVSVQLDAQQLYWMLSAESVDFPQGVDYGGGRLLDNSAGNSTCDRALEAFAAGSR